MVVLTHLKHLFEWRLLLSLLLHTPALRYKSHGDRNMLTLPQAHDVTESYEQLQQLIHKEGLIPTPIAELCHSSIRRKFLNNRNAPADPGGNRSKRIGYNNLVV